MLPEKCHPAAVYQSGVVFLFNEYIADKHSLFAISATMKKYLLASTLIILLTITGCNFLQGLSGSVQYPEVSYSDMKFESLSFDGITMNFTFDVDNPNRVDLRAQGYEYAFSVDGNEFMSGTSDTGIELKSRSSYSITVPIRFGFNELYNTVNAITTRDSIAYGINSVFSFDIPVMGRRDIPASASGYLPIPKIPRLSLENISVGNLSFTGAEVNVQLKFDNPNTFAIGFSDLNYILAIDGERWAAADIAQQVNLAPKSSQIVTIPVRLDIARLGTSVYRMLNGQQSFQYNVTGDGNINVDLPYFDDSSRIPFDLSGRHSF